MADAIRLPLDLFYEREKRHPNKRYMVQPLGGGQLLELNWAEVGEQARRAARWLRGRELAPGSRIAIVSKNCAHWIIADLAIWMAGHVSVPLYPNLTADSLRQVLEHSEAALAFVGLLAVAILPAAAGLSGEGLDWTDGWTQSLVITAIIAATGGVVSWLTIRKGEAVRPTVHPSPQVACQDPCVAEPRELAGASQR